MKPAVLIDGDIIVYQIASASETPIDWGEDFWTLHADAASAKEFLADRIRVIQEKLDAERVIIALSDDLNFRKSIYPKYKSNRAGKRKPMLIPVLKAFLSQEFEVFQRPGLEADDVLGILATAKKIIPGPKLVTTVDKDLKSIPCRLVSLDDLDSRPKEISEAEADRWHMIQTLTGDSADGYPGCPGIGVFKATKMLEGQTTYAEMWPIVLEAFAKAKLGEEVALTMARVARILRVSDYDFTKKEPKLWRP